MGHRRLLVVLLTILSFACSHKAEKKTVDDWHQYIDSKYQQDKSIFHNRFIDHFPKDLHPIEELIFSTIGKYPEIENVGFILCVKYTKKTLNLIDQKANDMCIRRYTNTDTCLLVLNKYVTKENIGFKRRLSSKEKMALLKASKMERVPIPKFINYPSESNTEYRLPEDYTLYVIEAKSGEFWENKYLMKDAMMPEEWKHGYSKGIAVSTRRLEVIYWFEIW